MMRKGAVLIALALLLTAPVLSLVSQLINAEQQKIGIVNSYPLSVDLEDEQDEADPEGNSESGLDVILPERFYYHQTPHALKHSWFGQPIALHQRDREVGTPPPRA